MGGVPIGLAVYSRLPNDSRDHRIIAANADGLSPDALKLIMFRIFDRGSIAVEQRPAFGFGTIVDPVSTISSQFAFRHELAPYLAGGFDRRDVLWTGFASTPTPTGQGPLVPPSELLRATPAADQLHAMSGARLPARAVQRDCHGVFVHSIEHVVEQSGSRILGEIAFRISREPVNLQMTADLSDDQIFQMIDSLYLLAPPAVRGGIAVVCTYDENPPRPRIWIRFGSWAPGRERPSWGSRPFSFSLDAPVTSYAETVERSLVALTPSGLCAFATRFRHEHELAAGPFGELLHVYAVGMADLNRPAAQSGDRLASLRAMLENRSALRLTDDEIERLGTALLESTNVRDLHAVDAAWVSAFESSMLNVLRQRLRANSLPAARELLRIACSRTAFDRHLPFLLSGLPPEGTECLAHLMLEVLLERNQSGQLATSHFDLLLTSSPAFAAELMRLAINQPALFERVAPAIVSSVLLRIPRRRTRTVSGELEQVKSVLSATSAASLQRLWDARYGPVCWDLLLMLCEWEPQFLPLMLPARQDEWDRYVGAGAEMLQWLRASDMSSSVPVEGESAIRIHPSAAVLDTYLERLIRAMSRRLPNDRPRLTALARAWNLSPN